MTSFQLNVIFSEITVGILPLCRWCLVQVVVVLSRALVFPPFIYLLTLVSSVQSYYVVQIQRFPLIFFSFVIYRHKINKIL